MSDTEQEVPKIPAKIQEAPEPALLVEEAPRMICGGHSAPREPEAQDKELIVSLREQIEKSAGAPFSTFEVTKITTQVVAGTKYKAKINVGDGKWVHVCVVQPLPHTGKPPELLSFTGDVGADDPL